MLILWFPFLFFCAGIVQNLQIFSPWLESWQRQQVGWLPRAVAEKVKRGKGVPVRALCRQLFIDLELLPYSKYQSYFFWLVGSGQVSSLLFTGAHPKEAAPWGRVRPAQPGGVN